MNPEANMDFTFFRVALPGLTPALFHLNWKCKDIQYFMNSLKPAGMKYLFLIRLPSGNIL
jgi:hypothetical protein